MPTMRCGRGGRAALAARGPRYLSRERSFVPSRSLPHYSSKFRFRTGFSSRRQFIWSLQADTPLDSTCLRLLHADIEHDIVAKKDHDLAGPFEEQSVSEAIVLAYRHPCQYGRHRQLNGIAGAVLGREETILPVVSKIIRGDLVTPTGRKERLISRSASETRLRVADSK